jgi:hypothetical protein
MRGLTKVTVDWMASSRTRASMTPYRLRRRQSTNDDRLYVLAVCRCTATEVEEEKKSTLLGDVLSSRERPQGLTTRGAVSVHL